MSLLGDRLLPEAAEELIGAAAWYEKERAGLGLRFLDAAVAARARLLRFPESGSPLPRRMRGRLIRRIWLTGFPIALVYWETVTPPPEVSEQGDGSDFEVAGADPQVRDSTRE